MLSFISRRGIVNRYIPRRSPFDKTNYIENYIPPRFTRKPRQEKWDDPSYNWPPKMPAPTQLRGRALVEEVEKEYLSSVKNEIEDIRTGDLVEVSNYYSLSNKQFSTFKGVVIARRKRNTINSSINVIGTVEGVQVEMHIKVHSPLVKEIKILEHGNGKQRARLNYFRDLTLSKYKALKKTAKRKFRPTLEAKEEEKRLRYLLLTQEE